MNDVVGQTKTDEMNGLIEDIRDVLRQAYAQAEANPDARAEIEQKLKGLTGIQEKLALLGLLHQAKILNDLSDVLDEVIALIRHDIDNFLFGKIVDLKKLVDQKAGKQADGTTHEPDLTPGASTSSPTFPVVDGQPAVILRASSGSFRRPNGPVVMALQLALIRAGQALEPDGDFGPITMAALRRWQHANGLPEQSMIDKQQWQRLTGSRPPSIFDLCLNVTADYEGTKFDRVVGNFDGAGITFGLIGFTLLNGELRRLLNSIESLRPGIVAKSFGALYPELQSVLGASEAQQLKWANSISLGAQRYEVAQPWKEAFRRIGQYPIARRAQIERAYNVYWAGAKKHINDFMQNRTLTDQDVAFWFDTVVQNSLDEEERTRLLEIGQSEFAGSGLREAFAEAVAKGSKAKWRADVRARKMTFAKEVGTVHGSEYRLSDWGISGASITPADLDAPSSIAPLLSSGLSGPTEELTEPDPEAGEASNIGAPAIIPNLSVAASVAETSPNSIWPLYGKFTSFFRTLGIRHFSADELLFLGTSNSAGPCKELNDYPPEELWKLIVPTIGVLDKLREDLGAPIHVISVYRSPHYNRCIDGAATNSFHMRFQAIDFVCDIGTPTDWAARLREYRKREIFSGGIGVYRTFVHVDTRGVNKTWTG